MKTPYTRRVLYTDGSVHRNGHEDASGAYAWLEVDPKGILREHASNIDKSGVTPTNMRMEMMAVISALHACEPEDMVLIRSDSAYIVNGMNDAWYEGWFKKGVNSLGKVPANLDLWHILVRATARISSVIFEHIKGHLGDPYNERCDQIAGMFSGGKDEEGSEHKYERPIH